jgi:hexosaminidase
MSKVYAGKAGSIVILLFVGFGILGLSLWPEGSSDVLALIPYPVEVERGSGNFALKQGVVMVVSPEAPREVLSTGLLICEKIRARTGIEVKIIQLHEFAPGQIALKIDTKDAELIKHGPEAYRVQAGSDVVLVASCAHGFFNAGMTLLQLLRREDEDWVVPLVTILDYPRFSHRGLLLDPARNFLSMEFVKRYVDLISQLKLNVLHFHLVDDQGWRLESKRFPRLHQVGGADGYYTQEEIRDLLAYADSRHVTVIPEIEMPGHCTAMLAAYPELSCSGEEVEVSKVWGIHRNAVCPCREDTYQFIDELIREVASLFPSEYIHIGSDEVMPKDWLDDPRCKDLADEKGLEGKRGLQSYFVGRVAEILANYNRRMIAWDEIVDYAPEGAVVQAWHNIEKAREAALAGHGAIVSPVKPWYFSYPEWMWSMKDSYLFDPVPEKLSAEQEKLIIGGEACMWGERAPQEKIDYKLFPRILALSEVLWSPKDNREFKGFKARVRAYRPVLEEQGVKFKSGAQAGIYPVIQP